MRALDCVEFDLADWCLFVSGKVVPAEDLELMAAFLVEIYIAA